MNGPDLLAEFRSSRSDAAFAELVRRYTNFVYSSALRRLDHVALAEEVTQNVFIRFARAVPSLRGEAELMGWLHRTVVHVSIDLWRSEQRRRVREKQAADMQTNSQEDKVWEELAPVLDEALDELNRSDRQVILLRFFAGKSMRDLGATLGVSEDAAKMRVSRAIERLRGLLGRRGVACSAFSLAAMLSERTSHAAPVAFASALAVESFPIAAVGGAPFGISTLFANLPKAKLALSLAVVATATVIVTIASKRRDGQRVADDYIRTNAPSAPPKPKSLVFSTNGYSSVVDKENPDPRKLLQSVMGARLQITSGSMEFQVSTDNYGDGQKVSSQKHLKVLFDDQRLRFESQGRQYHYVDLGGTKAQETAEATVRSGKMSHEAAVEAGLLAPFESYSVSIYDGTVLLRYEETDGRPNQGSIRDPVKNATGDYLFDPRCLGLSSFVHAGSTVQSCLAYAYAKSVTLAGQEPVNGVPAWHVIVRTKYNTSLEFWIDVGHRGRLLRTADETDVVDSKYDDSTPGNTLPIEVTIKASRNGAPLYESRLVLSKLKANIKIAPETWTLAGLGMQIGTDVVDYRNSRSIGRWDGKALSEKYSFSRSRADDVPEPPELADLLITLDNEPASEAALKAAEWIVGHVPDGPPVEKAGEVVIRNHVTSTNLVTLCKELERTRPNCAKPVWQAVMDQNPNPIVRAQAAFSWATAEFEAVEDYGKTNQAPVAVKLYERVLTETRQIDDSQTPVNGTLYGLDFRRKSEAALFTLRRMCVGQPAPETEGVDLDGEKRHLTDYRGKVVVLIFWVHHYDDAIYQREFAESLAGKPVAFIAVNCDNDIAHAREEVAKNEIPWPSIHDGRDGPIYTKWGLNGWPVFVLDRQGVIRSRGHRIGDVKSIVNSLIAE